MPSGRGAVTPRASLPLETLRRDEPNHKPGVGTGKAASQPMARTLVSHDGAWLHELYGVVEARSSLWD